MYDTFPVIILIGRPAAGKSEVIDYLKQLPAGERRARLHIAPFEEIDDFVWVWQIFEDDDVRERLGRERQNSTHDYDFVDPFLWDFLIGKINLAYAKKLAHDPEYARTHTTIIEFARGGENSLARAFAHLSDEILRQAVVVYVNVSFEESFRRNRRRARHGLEDSILNHSLPDRKMETLYKTTDWGRLSGGQAAGLLEINGRPVPFAVLENEPELTDDPARLGPALVQVMEKLVALRTA